MQAITQSLLHQHPWSAFSALLRSLIQEWLMCLKELAVRGHICADC